MWALKPYYSGPWTLRGLNNGWTQTALSLMCIRMMETEMANSVVHWVILGLYHIGRFRHNSSEDATHVAFCSEFERFPVWLSLWSVQKGCDGHEAHSEEPYSRFWALWHLTRRQNRLLESWEDDVRRSGTQLAQPPSEPALHTTDYHVLTLLESQLQTLDPRTPADRKGLWVYYNKIHIYPIFYLLKGDYTCFGRWTLSMVPTLAVGAVDDAYMLWARLLQSSRGRFCPHCEALTKSCCLLL